MNIDLSKFFKSGDRVAVAVSGGRDSMCLLHYLASHADGFQVFAVNVEHGIRGEASLKDSLFVKDYCKKEDIELVCFTVDSVSYQENHKVTVEEAARILRYNCFKELVDSGKADYVAVAHYRNDQCETVFMRLMRGTGIYGLTGILDKRDYIVRPMLDRSGEELDEYAKENNIPYIKDETNDDSSYTRNFIRNEVFPLLDKKFTGYRNSLIRLQRTAAEMTDMLEKMSAEIKTDGNKAVLKVSEVKGFRTLGKYNLLKTFRASGVFHDIEERHLDLLLEFADKGNGASLDMPYGVKVYKEYDNLVFVRGGGSERGSGKPFLINDFTFNGIDYKVKKAAREDFEKAIIDKGQIKSESGIIERKKTLFFDGGKIGKGAVIRNRKEKDFFKSFNGRTKLLSDYLTDKKIPKRIREELAIIADGDEVLIIAGYEISDKMKVTKDTKDIYTIE